MTSWVQEVCAQLLEREMRKELLSENSAFTVSHYGTSLLQQWLAGLW